MPGRMSEKERIGDTLQRKREGKAMRYQRQRPFTPMEEADLAREHIEPPISQIYRGNLGHKVIIRTQGHHASQRHRAKQSEAEKQEANTAEKTQLPAQSSLENCDKSISKEEIRSVQQRSIGRHRLGRKKKRRTLRNNADHAKAVLLWAAVGQANKLCLTKTKETAKDFSGTK